MQPLYMVILPLKAKGTIYFNEVSYILLNIDNLEKNELRERLKKKQKKLTNVSFMYVCVGLKWSYVSCFS